MEPLKILFVVYTPFEGFLPKRMAELTSKHKLDKTNLVVVTPDNHTAGLAGLVSDTVHLIRLHPDTDVAFTVQERYYRELKTVQAEIEKIKSHNI